MLSHEARHVAIHALESNGRMMHPLENSTRQSFVDATSRLLETQGYHGTGLSQIIKESGAPRGSLYYYFPDGKEELAAEALTQSAVVHAARMRSKLAAVENAEQAILRLFDLVIAEFQSTNFCGGAPVAAVALETAATNSRLRDACREAYALLHAPYVEKLMAGGYPQERALSLATTVSAALDGATILCRVEQSAEPIRRVRSDLQRLLESERSAHHTTQAT